MRYYTKLLAIGGVALMLAACKDDNSTDKPGGTGGAAANPDAPSAEAKADFSKAVATYERAKEDGSITGDECGRVAGAFDKVYQENKKSMQIARFNAGVIWEKCGKTDEAKKIYEELASANYHLAYNNLGVMYWNQGNTRKALEMFEKSIAADKVEAFAARNNVAAAHRDRYTAAANLEDFKTAENQIQNVLAVDTGNKAAYENLARLYYDRGRLKDKSYLVLANLVVQQALRVLTAEGEKSADIYNLKGLLLMQDNNQVDALKAFKQAVEVDKGHVDANLNIAFISIRFRDYASAELSLSEALKHESVKRDIEALIAMGVTKRGLKKYKDAEEYYNKAAALDAKDARPHYNLGLLNHEHLIGQEGVEKEQIEAFYNVAKKHFAKTIAVAGGDKRFAVQAKDAKDRSIIIDDAIATFRIMEQLEKKAAEIAKQEEAAAKKEIERLLELERKAAEAEAAAAAAPKETPKEAPKDAAKAAPKDAGGDKPKDAGGDKPKDAGGDKPKDAGGDKPKDAGGDKPKDAGGDKPK